MKRLIVIIGIIVIAGISLIALNRTQHFNISDDNITAIVINTLPESKEHSRMYRDTEKINKFIAYLNELSLKDTFTENPDKYNGMTSIIGISYADGRQTIVYHFGNMFIKENEGKWKRMTYNEAVKLHELIQDNSSD
ncbi:MAG: hypothetical protein RBQ97_11340 [Acholeplasma sp.]|nr:hypothetical protein [Acholeplasma sp.]